MITTTIIATCEGLVWVLIFRPYFGNKAQSLDAKPAELAFQCDEPGYFLTETNGSLACAFDTTYNTTEKFSAGAMFAALGLILIVFAASWRLAG